MLEFIKKHSDFILLLVVILLGFLVVDPYAMSYSTCIIIFFKNKIEIMSKKIKELEKKQKVNKV
jgi:hypothetical protein